MLNEDEQDDKRITPPSGSQGHKTTWHGCSALQHCTAGLHTILGFVCTLTLQIKQICKLSLQAQPALAAGWGLGAFSWGKVGSGTKTQNSCTAFPACFYTTFKHDSASQTRIHQQHAHLVRFMCFCAISMIYMIYYSFCLFLNILITHKQLIDKSTKHENLRQPPPTSANLTCPRKHLTTQNKGFCMFLNQQNLKFIREKCPSANLRQPPPTFSYVLMICCISDIKV